MPQATLYNQDPMVRIPHKGDGFTIWTLAEAKELHESMGAVIRQIEQSALRMKVSWADGVLATALCCFQDYRDGNVLTLPARTSEVIAATIDCLRAVLDEED